MHPLEIKNHSTEDKDLHALQANVELALLGHKQFLYTDKSKGTTQTIRHMSLFNEAHVKQCSCCDSYMTEGYVINGGEEYFCEMDCMGIEHTKEEIEAMGIGDEDSDSYWTSWEEIPTDYQGRIFQEYLENAEVGDAWENKEGKYTRTT